MKYLMLVMAALLVGWTGFLFFNQHLEKHILFIFSGAAMVCSLTAIFLNRTKARMVPLLVRFLVFTQLIWIAGNFVENGWRYENYLSAKSVAYLTVVLLFGVSLFIQLTWVRLERRTKEKRGNTRLRPEAKKRPKLPASDLQLTLGRSVERK